MKLIHTPAKEEARLLASGYRRTKSHKQHSCAAKSQTINYQDLWKPFTKSYLDLRVKLFLPIATCPPADGRTPPQIPHQALQTSAIGFSLNMNVKGII